MKPAQVSLPEWAFFVDRPERESRRWKRRTDSARLRNFTLVAANEGLNSMKQPIAGVVPSETAETTIMTIWPSIARYASGRWMGRLFSNKWPDVYIFRIGNLMALLLCPFAALLYFRRVAPRFGFRYRLTNRQMIVERGVSGEQACAIDFSDFDQVEQDVKSGQEWYDAADLVFCREGVEVFRLEGVSRPEPFRQTCLKARHARCSVAAVRRHQQTVT